MSKKVRIFAAGNKGYYYDECNANNPHTDASAQALFVR